MRVRGAIIGGLVALAALGGAAAGDAFTELRGARQVESIARAVAGGAPGAAEALEAYAGPRPNGAGTAALRGLALARAGKREAALAALALASERGFDGLHRWAETLPLRALLGGDPRLGQILRTAPRPGAPAPPAPAVPENRIAPVTAANTVWDPERRRLVTAFAFPEGEETPAPLLGILYDNRDGGHAQLDWWRFPGLMAIGYRGRAAPFARGMNGDWLHGAPVLGNASLAYTAGPQARSLPRAAMTGAGSVSAEALWQLFAANHLYVYPEHRDHDPDLIRGEGDEAGGRGDLFPANTPYLVISQGSSGSDLPVLRALAGALAALPAETRTRAIAEGAMGATLQMILRLARVGGDRTAYLTGAAHPSVFDGAALDGAAMAALAAGIGPGDLPPLPRLRVIGEPRPAPGPDRAGPMLSPVLFDTPMAAARIWRSRGARLRFELEASATGPRAAGASFRWAILRGDPERTRLRVLEDGRRAELTVDWQTRRPVPGDPARSTGRVEIGLFAEGGAYPSAPAFFSLALPGHETREIVETPAGPVTRRIRHGAPRDPRLFARRDWETQFEHDARGRLLGWTRILADGTETALTREGHRVTARDGMGRPAASEGLTARLVPDPKGGAPRVEHIPDGRRYTHFYTAPTDRLGIAIPAE